MPNPRSDREHMVEARDLTKRFPAKRSGLGSPVLPGKLAVDRVNLELHDGEIFGLVGPNGAGKTTLIKMLTTLLTPTSGSATIDGLDVVQDERQVRRIVGLVTSNERSFYWRLTGRQNLEFFASLHELPRRHASAWIDELLTLLDLKKNEHERFDDYSTGMKQRLAVARGLLCKPRFLFMDEPTKGVDPLGSATLVQMLRERIVEQWKPTILITSHDLSEIERLCNRIALMAHGRITATGTLTELRAMADSVDRFRVRVRNVDEQRLRAIATAAEAEAAIEFEQRNGFTDVTLRFRQQSEGFARFVRDVVQANGEILTATALEHTFDDVFHTLMNRAAEDRERETAP